MTIDVNINDDVFANNLIEELQKVKVPCQAAMANRFASIVHNNFGDDGEDRPDIWPSLKPKYAAWAHDGNRTPTLIFSGDLQKSIEIEEANAEFSSVFTNNEYAMMHQVGGKTEQGYFIPPRPFFPVTVPYGESVTEYTKAQCVAAASIEFERSIQ